MIILVFTLYIGKGVDRKVGQLDENDEFHNDNILLISIIMKYSQWSAVKWQRIDAKSESHHQHSRQHIRLFYSILRNHTRMIWWVSFDIGNMRKKKFASAKAKGFQIEWRKQKQSLAWQRSRFFFYFITHLLISWNFV